MIICPNCGHENDDSERVCQECRLRFRLPATRQIEDLGATDEATIESEAEVEELEGPFKIVLYIPTADKHINLPDVPEVLLGRFGDDGPDTPYVDLNEFGALHKGVSRIHASIKRDDNRVTLKDRHSANGTFVNGHLVDPGDEAALRHGDQIRLGAFIADIRFERLPDEGQTG